MGQRIHHRSFGVQLLIPDLPADWSGTRLPTGHVSTRGLFYSAKQTAGGHLNILLQEANRATAAAARTQLGAALVAEIQEERNETKAQPFEYDIAAELDGQPVTCSELVLIAKSTSARARVNVLTVVALSELLHLLIIFESPVASMGILVPTVDQVLIPTPEQLDGPLGEFLNTARTFVRETKFFSPEMRKTE